MNNYKPNEYEEEIDLIELFWELIAGLKWIVLSALICAVLAGGFKYMKDSSSYKTAVNVSVDDSMMALKDSFSPAELDGVENLYMQIVDAKKQGEVLADDIVLKLDSSDVTKISLCFVVDGDDATKNSTVADVYNDYLSSGEFAVYLAKALGDKYSTADIMNLIKVSDINYYKSDNYVAKENTGVVNFSMYLTEDMDSAAVVNAVKNGIEEKRSRVNAINPHDVLVVNESVAKVCDESIKRYQSDLVYSNYNIHSIVLSARNSLTEEQRSYLDYMLESDGAEIAENASSEKEEVQAVPAPSISLKFILVGFVLGAFIACGIICVLFIFSVKLSSAQKLVDRFGGKLFGKVGAHSLKDRKTCKRSVEDQIKTIVTGIILCCKQMGIQQIAFTGTDLEHLNAEYLDAIEAEVKKGGIDVVRLGNIFYDSEALIRCAEIGKAVVIEGVGVSIYDEISNEIIKANEYNIELIGSVVL